MNAKILLQYILPHRLLSRVVYYATRWTWRPWKNALIDLVVRRYAVDLGEAAQPDPHAYASFNDFFTRRLAAGARPQDLPPAAIACPADGRISQAGPIRAGRIVQAKGRDFSVAELLGDAASAQAYAEGQFATIYLSPRDYHRVHMPLDGSLRQSVHIPGRIFSVAPFTVAAIPRLFARNERLVCHFEGPAGPFAVVLVGAMLVSSISTVWGGLQVPPYAHRISRHEHRESAPALARMQEMGHFNMGSTVIVLLPPGSTLACLTTGQAVRVGQQLGLLSGSDAGQMSNM